jgi:DnaJ family protein C protein 11
MGFYDPCPGEPKQLYVLYRFKDKLHSVTINDTDSMACPLRGE